MRELSIHNPTPPPSIIVVDVAGLGGLAPAIQGRRPKIRKKSWSGFAAAPAAAAVTAAVPFGQYSDYVATSYVPPFDNSGDLGDFSLLR